ncbi:phosphate acetyltransferase [Atribacter laminatus]|uniref:Phosphate acetyltransferase n=1 Tax=Atribacter laminatus TaxID=2847778 RepID=A0A7T1AJ61_ATRLM|nr:phosphate acetyltransferase [Atribacter laminatus]QPM66904.1 Phosphate acetyltransferase [Atribacter laminatus]
MNVLEEIRNRAKSLKKTIALPEYDDERVLQAAEIATRDQVAAIQLVGDPTIIEQKSKSLGISLSGVEIIDHKKDQQRSEYVQSLYELRKGKGLTQEQAEQWLESSMYYACMMLYHDRIDGIVSGASLSSPDVIRPALQIIKTTPGVKLASSCFLMVVPDCPYGSNGVFLYADSGFNPNPNSEELAHIALTTARSAIQLLGVEPIVAMLSFSTKGSARHELVDKVIEATAIAHSLKPELLIDGELQGDAALVPSVGDKKAPGSKVAGKANVLIFPDLNAGNICYKLTERLARATAIGPILQGLAKPVNDLSRGCKAQDIVDQIAVTVLQTQF